MAFRTLTKQLSWVGKESRPEVAGAASILSSHDAGPSVGHVVEANKAVALLRASASQKLTIWKFNNSTMAFAAATDSAGPGAADGTRTQGSWIILAIDNELTKGHLARVTPLAWR